MLGETVKHGNLLAMLRPSTCPDRAFAVWVEKMKADQRNLVSEIVRDAGFPRGKDYSSFRPVDHDLQEPVWLGLQDLVLPNQVLRRPAR